MFIYFKIDENHDIPNSVPMLYEGALASFLNSALGFSPTLFLQLPRSSFSCKKFISPKLYIRPWGIDNGLIRWGRMYSLGEVNFIQGMLDLGNPKNSVGLKPIAVRLSNLNFLTVS